MEEGLWLCMGCCMEGCEGGDEGDGPQHAFMALLKDAGPCLTPWCVVLSMGMLLVCGMTRSHW